MHTERWIETQRVIQTVSPTVKEPDMRNTKTERWKCREKGHRDREIVTERLRDRWRQKDIQRDI